MEKLCKPGENSQNIVVVLRHGLLATVPYYYFDMELCDFDLEKFGLILWKPAAWEEMLTIHSGGIDVDSRMKQVWAIMSHVASGLHYIHMHQEIHRDLKPRNSTTLHLYLLKGLVLYSRRDGMWKIADFGLSRTGSSQAQTTVNSWGTSGYRAPELLVQTTSSSKPTFTNKADIWALGCVLYWLVSGRLAFDHEWAAYQWAFSKEPLHCFEKDPANGAYKFSSQSPGNAFLQSVVTAMLLPEASSRPTAAALIATSIMAHGFFSPGNATLPTDNELKVFLEGVPHVFWANNV